MSELDAKLDRFAARFKLTPVEVEVAAALARGYSPNQVAEVVPACPRTVKDRLRRVRRKVGAANAWDVLREIYATEASR